MCGGKCDARQICVSLSLLHLRKQQTTVTARLFYYVLQSVAGLPLRPVFFLTVCQRITHTMCICLLLPPGNKVVWQSCSSETAAMSCVATSPVALHCNSITSSWCKASDTLWRQSSRIKKSWSRNVLVLHWWWMTLWEQNGVACRVGDVAATHQTRSHNPSLRSVVMNLKLIKTY